MGDYYVWFCERYKVKFLLSTQQKGKENTKRGEHLRLVFTSYSISCLAIGINMDHTSY